MRLLPVLAPEDSAQIGGEKIDLSGELTIHVMRCNIINKNGRSMRIH